MLYEIPNWLFLNWQWEHDFIFFIQNLIVKLKRILIDYAIFLTHRKLTRKPMLQFYFYGWRYSLTASIKIVNFLNINMRKPFILANLVLFRRILCLNGHVLFFTKCVPRVMHHWTVIIGHAFRTYFGRAARSKVVLKT